MTAQQLKNSILQMAVQGKLVPQDPNDEPASVLLERIRAEKERLIKEKKIKREKNPSVIFKGADNTPYEKIGGEVRSLADEVPFDIPDSWEWVRLKDVAFTNGGFAFKSANFVDEGIRVIRISDFNENGFVDTKIVRHPYNDSLDRFLLNEKNILLCMTGGTVGKSYFVTSLKEQMVTNQRVATIKIFGALEEYVNLVILSPITQKVINDSKNSTNDNISIDTINGFFVPLPPIDEQRRIVDTIASVLQLIDKYEEKYSRFSRLQGAFPEVLKKSILQEAVQGKLVPQDPSDEPAEALLERIRAEKQRLIKEGKIKKDKHESVIFRRDNSHYEKRGSEEVCIDEEIPFEIPENWAWCRASSLGIMVRGRGIKRTETVAQGCPCIRYGEIYTTYDTSFDAAVSFVPESLDKDCLHFSSGDVVFTLTGENKVDIAKTVAFLGDGQIAAGGDLAFWTYHGMNPLYLVYYMASPYCIELKRRTATGDIIVHISTSKVGDFLVPVPPINEQNRIVAAIEQLFAVASTL